MRLRRRRRREEGGSNLLLVGHVLSSQDNGCYRHAWDVIFPLPSHVNENPHSRTNTRLRLCGEMLVVALDLDKVDGQRVLPSQQFTVDGIIGI